MSSRLLLRLRQIFATGVLGLLLLSFLDFGGWLPTSFYRTVNALQFAPSLLKFLHIPSLMAAGFLLILLLTLLFGRVYCSWLCPLGILQDLIHRLRKKKRKKGIYKYLKPLNLMRYSVLAIVTVLLVAGTSAGLVGTDPYSVFGRFAHHLVLPGVIALNNLLSSLLESIGHYILKPFAHPGFHLYGFLFALLLLSVIAWLSLRKGRIYCTAWCPVGTFLSLVARFSVVRIYLDDHKCTSCGLCGAACKAGCIDPKTKKVDFDRCIGCFQCLSSCTGQGVIFGIPPRKEDNPGHPDSSRRKALALMATATFGLAFRSAARLAEKTGKALIPNKKNAAVSPPGSLSLDRFNRICTGCHLCVGACPTHVLQPSVSAYGLKGFMQPHMDYHVSFCNYECTRCSEVCPTGAIARVSPEEKKSIQLGKARFIEENCVVITDGTACGACSEHCPTKAVNMIPWRNGLTLPHVEESICVGCGACEFACPTLPFRAIFVDGNAVHQVANPPQGDRESKEEVPEEFPF